ncbi:sodium-translocating pyrophosphatase [Thermotoga sp.]|uniref:sodium-translocating pyrophosphatase n=1 Tax=Thermotoga sp. TaxID=28240 RepID=UPI0025EB5556|nr:sodium-translocating pyrophosphatase [Thermotoga sp.]MCD6551799.1 sodium-translocating pyrophosphatase [Thermotoga sp.]
MWLLFLVPLIALGFAAANFSAVVKKPEGTDRMKEISFYIRSGADSFLSHETKAIFKVAIVIAILLMIFTTWQTGVAFLLGAVMSASAGIVGMKMATRANVRVTEAARTTRKIGPALKVAYQGGSVMGLSVGGFALLGLVLVYLIFGKWLGQLDNLNIYTNWLGVNFVPFAMTVSGYALGCSIIAMFDRVGGGVYTKAADMAADLVGKTELNLPEDDPRNPATIADNVGDNVGDVAGLGADLLESFVGAIVSSIILASYMFPIYVQKVGESLVHQIPKETIQSLITYPILFALVGLGCSMLGILYVIVKRPSDNPQRELNISLWTSAILTVVLTAFLTYFYLKDAQGLDVVGFRFGPISPWFSAIIGIFAGILVGFWAEYYTSYHYRPTQFLSRSSIEGTGMVISNGLSLGMKSVLPPTLTLVLGILFADYFAGLYGVAISALGMLSFVATSVSVDSYGPIADNAGGISEMCELDPEVRKITDHLDAVGNTTAAIGKGFAIGSAILAALSLFASYMFSQISPSDVGKPPSLILLLNMVDARVIAGALLGAAITYYFSGYLISAVTKAAMKMVDEIRRQAREIPGLLEGKAKPDYNRCIEITSDNALKQMGYPALIAILTPLVTGFLLGPKFVGGVLIGTVISGAMLAILTANSGGAWDNAKKFLEAGNLEGYGKGSEPHKALVIGDTVGDPLKDTVGPSLDILIKIMSVVSVIAVSIFKHIHLF